MSDPGEGLIPTQCPYCGHKLECATAFGAPEARPKAGDATLCINCAGVLQYVNAQGSVQPAEIVQFPLEVRSEIERIQQAIVVVGHTWRRRN